MSRCTLAVAGAVVFAIALTPGEALAAGGSSSAARSAGAHAKKANHAAPSSVARVGTRRRAEVLLQRGSGYRQANGSGRVRALQRGLVRLGDRPGPIDGLYGPLTTRAVIRFQRAQGLRVDGIAGPKTLTRLGNVLSGRELTRATPSRSARPAHSLASSPVSPTAVLGDGLTAAPLTRPMAVSRDSGAGHVFRAWMILAVLLAAAVMSAAAALSRSAAPSALHQSTDAERRSVGGISLQPVARGLRAQAGGQLHRSCPQSRNEPDNRSRRGRGSIGPGNRHTRSPPHPTGSQQIHSDHAGSNAKRTRTGASRTSKPRS